MAKAYLKTQFNRSFLYFKCPACNVEHGICLKTSNDPAHDLNATWNGDPYSPTLNEKQNLLLQHKRPNKFMRCIFSLKSGVIYYDINDMRPNFSGRQAELPELDETAREIKCT